MNKIIIFSSIHILSSFLLNFLTLLNSFFYFLNFSTDFDYFYSSLAPFYFFFLLVPLDLRFLLCILGNTLHLNITSFPSPRKLVSLPFSLHIFVFLLFLSQQFFVLIAISLVYSLPFPFCYIFHDGFDFSFQYEPYLYLCYFHF